MPCTLSTHFPWQQCMSSHAPAEWHDPHKYCQRNAVMLAFESEMSVAQCEAMQNNTEAGMLVEEFCRVLSKHLQCRNQICSDIDTKVAFGKLLTPKTAWMMSPVHPNGSDGHCVVIADGVWYDSAQVAPIDITKPNWPVELAYGWIWWCCRDVRQLFPPWLQNPSDTLCTCGLTLTPNVNVAQHKLGKKHIRRMEHVGKTHQ